MSAADLIAEAIASGMRKTDRVLDWDREGAQAVIEAIRAATPEVQAELIGGDVDRYVGTGKAHVVGPWVPVEGGAK